MLTFEHFRNKEKCLKSDNTNTETFEIKTKLKSYTFL